MWVMGSHMFRKDIGHHLSIKMIKICERATKRSLNMI